MEAAIAHEAVCAGVEVFKPLSEHARADLIFGIGSELFRVQCKSARRSGQVLVINLSSCRHTPTAGYIRTTYTTDEVDLIAAHCHELKTSYLIPFESLGNTRSAIQLRLAPPKNQQRAAIHFAAEYEFAGAVAQLEERRRGTAEATGSSPVSSTQSTDDAAVVGAHIFRNHFGYYMERAEAGEDVTVTRRGRPAVRLTAIQPELDS